MSLIIIITVILITIFLLNYLLYWIFFLKTERKRSKGWDNYTKIYLIIWALPIIIIPIITSSFFSPYFDTITYFQQFWIFSLLLGIVFLVFAINLGRLTMKKNKIRGFAKGKYHLITEGTYEIMRHPMYASWALIFFGLTLFFDSLISLIITPFLMLFLAIAGFIEEKKLLLPQFGEKYEEYKEKTKSRLFPMPYSFLLILIAIFIVYIGVVVFIMP